MSSGRFRMHGGGGVCAAGPGLWLSRAESVSVTILSDELLEPMLFTRFA